MLKTLSTIALVLLILAVPGLAVALIVGALSVWFILLVLRVGGCFLYALLLFIVISIISMLLV